VLSILDSTGSQNIASVHEATPIATFFVRRGASIQNDSYQRRPRPNDDNLATWAMREDFQNIRCACHLGSASEIMSQALS